MWLDWLVSCDYSFESIYPLMEKDQRLMEASWWERLRWKLGLVLVGGAMLIKSLIQFSVDGWSCFTPCYLPEAKLWWIKIMKIMLASLKRSHECIATLSAPIPAAGHHWPTPLPETPGHSRASLEQSLRGSLLLSPGSWYTRFYNII